MLTTLTHDEYIRNLDKLNQPGSLICFRGDGCFTMCCDGKLIKTQEELEKLQRTENEHKHTFEVRFVPFNMLDVKKNIRNNKTSYFVKDMF